MRGCLRGAQSSEEGRSICCRVVRRGCATARVLLPQKRCKAGFAPDAMEGAKCAMGGQRWQGRDRRGSTEQILWFVELLRRVG